MEGKPEHQTRCLNELVQFLSELSYPWFVSILFHWHRLCVVKWKGAYKWHFVRKLSQSILKNFLSSDIDGLNTNMKSLMINVHRANIQTHTQHAEYGLEVLNLQPQCSYGFLAFGPHTRGLCVLENKCLNAHSASNSMFVFICRGTCCPCLWYRRSGFLQNIDAHVPNYRAWHPKWLKCLSVMPF